MSEELKLLPCPFCGSNELFYESTYVYCNNCNCLGPDVEYDEDGVSKSELIEAWNRRTIISEPIGRFITPAGRLNDEN
jgi:Lar family restriction alleviation protein